MPTFICIRCSTSFDEKQKRCFCPLCRNITITCETCGRPFASHLSSSNWKKVGDPRFCSHNCQLKQLAALARTITERECPICHKVFRPSHSHGIYCSKTCSGQANIVHHILVCQYCNRQFEADASYRKYCSHRCYSNSRYRRITIICQQCKNPFGVLPHDAESTKYCSYACNNRARTFHTWDDNPGPYYGPNWQDQRDRIRTRDNYICQSCGQTEGQLNRELDVHHIRPFSDFTGDWKEANKTINLISLCQICHPRVERNIIRCPPLPQAGEVAPLIKAVQLTLIHIDS